MPEGDSRITKKNQEQLFLKGDSAADTRRMFSYPSSVSGLKGVGGKIIILEEASRLDEAVFTEVVVPLFGVRDTVVLAISTPLDGDNYYSQARVCARARVVFIFLKSLSVADAGGDAPRRVAIVQRARGETPLRRMPGLRRAELPAQDGDAAVEDGRAAGVCVCSSARRPMRPRFERARSCRNW